VSHIVGCKELDDVHGAISTHGAFVSAASVTYARSSERVARMGLAYTILPLGDTSAHAPFFTEHVPSLAKHNR
jgi:hypothetical protein